MNPRLFGSSSIFSGLVPRTDGEQSAPISPVGRKGRRGEGWALALGWILVMAALWPAFQESGTPPAWDQSNHLKDSLVYERILREPSVLNPTMLGAMLKGSEEYPLWTPSGYYPPLVPGVTAFLYIVLGRSYETAMVTSGLFLALLAWGVWGIGNRLLGPPAGLLAALWVLAAPAIRLNAREYMLDLPLAALVSLAVWSLLSTEGFSKWGPSILFGLLCAAGMLTKWTFFLFLLLPVLFVLVESHRDASGLRGEVKKRWVHIGLALAAGAFLMAPYYAPILPILIHKTWTHAGGAADGFASVLTWDSMTYHLEALPRKLFGWPLTLAVVLAVGFFPRVGRLERRALLFLGTWALSLYGIFTFAVANKQSRYLLPWIPVLLLLGAGGLLGLHRKFAREKSWKWLALGTAVFLLPALGLAHGWQREESGDWQISALVDHLEEDLDSVPPENLPVFLGVIPDMRHVNGPTVAYYASRRDLPVSVVQLVNRMKEHIELETGLDPFDRGDFYNTFDRYEYILTKTGDNAVPPWEKVVPEMHAYFETRKEQFRVLVSLAQPDHSTLTLYRRQRR